MCGSANDQLVILYTLTDSPSLEWFILASLFKQDLFPNPRPQRSVHCVLGSSDVHPLPPSRPSNGGQDCPGVNYEYQLCNTDDCPKHFEDFRAQQCQLRNSHFEFQNAKHHWLPYEHPDGTPKKCQQIVLFRVRLLCLFLSQEERTMKVNKGMGSVFSQQEKAISLEAYYISKTGIFPTVFDSFRTLTTLVCAERAFSIVFCVLLLGFSFPSFPLLFFCLDSLTHSDSLSQ